MNRYKNELDMDEPDQEILDGADPLTRETGDVDTVNNSDSSDLLNEAPFPWEKWEQLPKEEREAEMKEAAKQAGKEDKDETAYAQLDQAEPLIGETVGRSDEKHIPSFPFWDNAEPTIESEAVGGHFFDTAEPEAVGHRRGLFPLPDFSDQSANVDEQQNAQVDAITRYSLNNDDAAGFDWFHMHHDDGIMDGYLDTAEGEFNSKPETLTPIDLNSALVTDAYQQQDAPGADLIAGEANQGMDPYQAQGGRYEVLA
jgi:hypothetical protein